MAAIRGNVEAVVTLLEGGCPPDTRNERGWVALMEAAEMRHRDVALKLAKAEMLQVRAVLVLGVSG